MERRREAHRSRPELPDGRTHHYVLSEPLGFGSGLSFRLSF